MDVDEANNGDFHVTAKSDDIEGDTESTWVDVDSREVAFDDIADEHFRTVLDYWTGVRGETFAPAWTDFDLLGLPSNIIPSMTVVDLVGDEMPDFRYRFWGTRQAAFKARDYTGLSVRDLRPESVAAAVTDQYMAVFKARAPLVFQHNVRSVKMGIPLEQTTIRMPLSNDGDAIDKFVSYCAFPKPVHEVHEFFANHLDDD